jgi:hypothetical protein
MDDLDARLPPILTDADYERLAAPFGKFAGPPRRRWQAAGGFAGAPDRQRQGSFADMQVGRRRRPT